MSELYEHNEKNVTKSVNVLTGETLEYDICVSEKFLNDYRVSIRGIYNDYVYLGSGFISEVENKPYKGTALCHFWRKNK